MRILLVEDSADIRLLLKIQMEALGYVVLTAENGRIALEMARREHPELIISDIRMPDMDGYELLRRLRSVPELAPIPCIALTAMSTVENKAPGEMAAGFDAYVSKLTDPDKLAEVIREVEASSRLRSDAALERATGERSAPA